MNTQAKPRFRHSAQFPWFVLAVTAVLVTAVAGIGMGLWWRIEMLQQFLGTL